MGPEIEATLEQYLAMHREQCAKAKATFWDRGEIEPFQSLADIASRIVLQWRAVKADDDYDRAAEDAQRCDDAREGFED